MLRRILRNRLIVSLFILVITAVIAFVFLPQLYSQKGATMMVYTASTNILKGTVISENMIKSTEVGSYGLPGNVITEKEEVIGQYASMDMLAGDLLIKTKIQNYKISSVLDEIIKNGLRLVTVTFHTSAAGLASHLQQGDIVQVASYTEIDRVPYVISYPELMQIKVYDIENAKTQSVERVRGQTDTPGSTSDDPIPKTVTLIATDEQATKLIEAEYFGQIHLIFVSRGE